MDEFEHIAGAHGNNYICRLKSVKMNAFIFLFGLGVPEWILIILAIVLLFGGKKIPELMRGIGQGIREFNSAKNDVQQHIREGMKEDEKNKGTENKD